MVNVTFWKNKRVLVTGGSGFVGRWVGRRGSWPPAPDLHILDIVPPKDFSEPFTLHRADLRDLACRPPRLLSRDAASGHHSFGRKPAGRTFGVARSAGLGV